MKREALLRQLRAEARRRGVPFAAEKTQGKGSHYLLRFGAKKTTLKSGELSPLYVSLVKKQLGL